MTMRRLVALLGLSMFTLSAAVQSTPGADTAVPKGRLEDGRLFWKEPNSYCARCHGSNGEGAFGPDLAGRGLSFEQVRKALREPWGIMPRYDERYLNDQTIADLTAFFGSLPTAARPGQWRSPRSDAGAPAGDRALTVTAGCSQCHDLVGADRVGSWRWGHARAFLGANPDIDYQWFETNAYDHGRTYPNGRMGTFSRDRFPESLLREGWRWLTEDLGRRPRIQAEVTAGTATGANTAYAITIRNTGEKGKGLAAEQLSLRLALPAGVTVVGATGTGYQGTRDASPGNRVATWMVRRLEPGESETVTATISGATTAKDLIQDALVTWQRPKVGDVDQDAVRVNLARPPAPSAGR